MSYKVFTEKEIRQAILNKVEPRITHKKGGHWKGSIYLGDMLVSKVKIPNPHLKDFNSKKAKFLSDSLLLNDIQYNGLVSCTLGKNDYYAIVGDQ